jgi:hypothetical protein
MAALDESRDMLKNSYDEFKLEQNEYKQQLEKIAQIKEAGMHRRKGINNKFILRNKVISF